MVGASAHMADGQQTFGCDYCNRQFNSRRARGGHLKAHRHQRASQQAVQPQANNVRQPKRSLVRTSAPVPPPQQQQNTSQELAVVVWQPRPQQEQLALPEPNTSSALVTVPVIQSPPPRPKNAQDSTPPVVLFRCCCGEIEKIPQTKEELMERGTYEGGCFTLNHRHQHRRPEEIQLVDLAPPAEAAAQENSVDNDVESAQEIDLTLRL